MSADDELRASRGSCGSYKIVFVESVRECKPRLGLADRGDFPADFWLDDSNEEGAAVWNLLAIGVVK